MWRSIWNGPFYIGKLTQPVSVGDVMMKVLETLWRTALVGVALFAGLIALILGNSRMESRRNDDAERNVVVNAHRDPSCQPGEFAVTIQNNSKYTITYASYRVNMTLNGVDVTPDHLRNLWTGTDISPDHHLTTCHSTAWTSYGTPTSYRTEEGTVLGGSLDFVSAK